MQGLSDNKKKDQAIADKYAPAFFYPDMIKAFKMSIDQLQPYKDDPEVKDWIDKYAAEVSRMEEELKK